MRFLLLLLMRLVFAGLLALLAGCDVMFPSAVDPCPTPPEQHPEAWQPMTVVNSAGEVVTVGYTCIAR